MHSCTMRGWKSTMASKHYLNEDGKWKSERNLALQHRALMHDYRAKGTYMITLCANARKPIFGDLICHADGTAQIIPTTVGKIVEAEWNAIRNHIPQIEILDYQLMPDHIHGLIKAKETLPISLGQIIRRYKMRCTSLYRALIHDASKGRYNKKAEGTPLFCLLITMCYLICATLY